MSNSNYREINNALNNYYGNKMNLYEEGSEYREEYRQKMKEQKKLVKELSIKAEAFDRICKAHVPLEKRMSPVTVDEGLDFAVEAERVILKFYESGEYND